MRSGQLAGDVQSTEILQDVADLDPGRGRLRACAARILWVSVIGRADAEAIERCYMHRVGGGAHSVSHSMLANAMDTWYERLSTSTPSFSRSRTGRRHARGRGGDSFEGPPPPYRDLLALIGARLEHVPRYRQRGMTVPLKQGRPSGSTRRSSISSTTCATRLAGARG